MKVFFRYGLTVFLLFVVSISSVAVVQYICADSHITAVDAVVVLTGNKTRLLDGIALMSELSADYLVIPWHRQLPWNQLKKKYHIQVSMDIRPTGIERHSPFRLSNRLVVLPFWQRASTGPSICQLLLSGLSTRTGPGNPPVR